MKKLRLQLDDLAVESFATAEGRGAERGTVRGHASEIGRCNTDVDPFTNPYDSWTNCPDGWSVGGNCPDYGSNEVTCDLWAPCGGAISDDTC